MFGPSFDQWRRWCFRYDPANEGIVDGRKFLNALGIEWRGQSGPTVRTSPLIQETGD